MDNSISTNLTEPFSVVQINVLGATQSTGRTTRELHEYLKSHSINSYIVCPMKTEEYEDIYAYNSQMGIYLDYSLTLLTGIEGIHSTFQTRRLVKYLKQIRPDIVHLRVMHSYSINFGILFRYCKKNRIPVVVTLHDFWFMTGQCVYYTAKKCNKWENGCHDCKYLNFRGRKPLFDMTKRMWENKKKWFESLDYLAVIGVSKWVAEEAKRSFLKCANVLEPIYNWIDLDVFYPRESKQLREKYDLQNKKVILAVSTYWESGDRKGYDFYEQFSSILPKDWVLVMVGKLRNEKPVNDSIIFVPSTNNVEELATLYSMADVYLNLSEEETFGKVSAEALACGTPIVAFDSTANSELVPKNGGIIIKSRDSDTIAEAVRCVFSKPKSEYIDICRTFAKTNFEKEENIRKYVLLYRELIEKKEKENLK